MAGRAGLFHEFAMMAEVQFALIGGEAGFVTWVDGVLSCAMAFTVRDDKIVANHVIQDKEQLAALV